jgi:hypothetical protein
MSQWFRMYAEVLEDPKVQRLSAEMYRAWVNLLCLACRMGGGLPGITDIAFALRMQESRAKATVAGLINAGLLEQDETGLRPHNWNGRQYKSDVSTERVKRFRERSGNVSQTVSETPPEADTETESESEKKEEGSRPVDNSPLGASRRLARQANGAQYADPAIRKQRWEQKVSTFLIETKGADEAMRIIDAYGHGDKWAKKAFNVADEQRKATSARNGASEG